MCGKGERLAFSITAAGAALAEGRTTEEIALLSSVFMQLGDTLSTIASARLLEAARKKAAGGIAASSDSSAQNDNSANDNTPTEPSATSQSSAPGPHPLG